MATTPRLNMRRPEGGDAFSVHTDLQSIVDPLDNAAIDQQGTLAARPAANTVPQGTYFFTTNELKLYRSDGTSWNYVIPNSSVDTEHLVNDSVNGAKLAGSSVVQNHLVAGSDGMAAAAFSARISSASGPGASTIAPTTGGSSEAPIYNQELYDLSNVFNIANSRFTAPIAAVYRLSATFMGTTGAASGRVDLVAFRNTGLYETLDSVNVLANTPFVLRDSIALQLAVGDWLEFRLINWTTEDITYPVGPDFRAHAGVYGELVGKV